jgi:hypothetical protein
LIGSKQFVTMPPVPINQVEAYVNFDMVGRMKDNKLAAQATGTSPIWASLIEARQRPRRVRHRDSTRPVSADGCQQLQRRECAES